MPSGGRQGHRRLPSLAAVISLYAGFVRDAFDPAAVDVEFTGYGALTVTRLVPVAYGPLQRQRGGQPWWCIPLQ